MKGWAIVAVLMWGVSAAALCWQCLCARVCTNRLCVLSLIQQIDADRHQAAVF